MAGKVLDFNTILKKDSLASQVAETWFDWEQKRAKWKQEKAEIRAYIFATDTSGTSNAGLPWNNKTHIPKLCQIRDNLFANYSASLFPKRKWLLWEGIGKGDEDPIKVDSIKSYMSWVIAQKQFKDEVYKLIYDYIDYGNTFATVEWEDGTRQVNGETIPSFVGPKVKRINPLDIVMNPVAQDSSKSPKIVRTLWTLGEAKTFMESLTATEEEKELATGVWNYLKDVRSTAIQHGGEFKELDSYFHMDGFSSFRDYLGSNYIEVLSFYGDFYDRDNDTLYRKQVIHVVDRHKVIYNKPHSTPSGEIPIFHSGWRIRQDNLLAMGPLDNLVGMQYRIDHVENLKADIFDLTVFPPLKIRGLVEDFEWGPFERIHVDGEGDVELMTPKADILTANIEIQAYEQRMEEMAGSPREAMGFRSPGEKTAFEVQRLENAASRIFQSKIRQFEEQILEPILNEMLAIARVNLTTSTIRVIADEFKTVAFQKLSKEDLSAQGRLKPVAARHFAEKAEIAQNLNTFYSSAMGSDPEIRAHFSSKKIASMAQDILGFEDYDIYQDWVRVYEQQEGQRLANAGQEQVSMEQGTPAGVAQNDF